MTTENEADMQTSAEPRATDSGVVTGIPGIIAHLGELESGAIIQEKGLCMLFDRKTDSVRRAVEHGDLPPPVRLFGQNTWTAGVLVRHLEARLEQAAQEAEQRADDVRRKMLELSP